MFALQGVAVRGAASTAPCSFSIIAFCFPNGTSSSSSPASLAPLTTGTSDRKSRSSVDKERELLLEVDFGREKRFKNLETADCAEPSVVTVGSTRLAIESAGVSETGETVVIDETETEVVTTGGAG